MNFFSDSHATFNLELRIKNQANKKVILCAACVQDNTPIARIVKNDGTVGPVVYDLNVDRFDVPAGQEAIPDRPGKGSVILGAGEEVVLQRSTTIDVSLDDYHRPWSFLPQGRYEIRARFITWWASPERTEAVRSRWKSYGVLYDSPLTSDPIIVDLKRPESVEPCTKPR